MCQSRLLCAILCCVVALPFAAGCKRTVYLPTTYPVSGKVVFREGQPAAHAGIVRFQSEADQRIAATGLIDDNGYFSLSAFVNNERAPGTVPGVHRAEVLPVPDRQQTVPHSTKLLQDKFTVESRENQFTLTLEQRSPK